MFLALLHLGLKPPCLYQDCLLEAILQSALTLLHRTVPVAAVSVPCCPGSSLALDSFPPPTCQHHAGPSLLPALGPHFPAPPQGSATRCRYPSAALLPSFESITLPQKIPLVLFLLGLLPSLVGFSGHHCLAFSPAPSAGQPTVTEGHSPPQILLCPTRKYTARNSPYELQNAAESPFQNGQIHPLSLPLLPQTGSPFFIFYF